MNGPYNTFDEAKQAGLEHFTPAFGEGPYCFPVIMTGGKYFWSEKPTIDPSSVVGATIWIVSD